MFSASAACCEYSPTFAVVALKSTFDSEEEAIVNFEVYGPLLATPGSKLVWVSVTEPERIWVDVEPSLKLGATMQEPLAIAAFDTAELATNATTPRAAKMRLRVLPITVFRLPAQITKNV